ncbi:MAG TPA: hypothetical protein V6D26_09770 [Stenomitos sp.]
MNTYVNGSSVAHREQEWELQEAAHYSQSQMEGLHVMATQASQVFGNSQVVTRGIIRNALIQKRTTH